MPCYKATIGGNKQKGRPEAAFWLDNCYWQQLPLAQQSGSPQHMWTVAAEADRDKSIAAAKAIDRTFFIIRISFGFQYKKGMAYT